MHALIGDDFNEYGKILRYEVVSAYGRTCRSIIFMFAKLSKAYASTEDSAITYINVDSNRLGLILL